MRPLETYLVEGSRLALLALALAAPGTASASKPPRAAAPVAVAAVDAGPEAVDGGAPHPENFSVEAPPQVKFGEPFPFTVRVSHAKGEVYALPKSPDLGDFDLVSSEKRDQPDGDKVTTVFELQLRAWNVGKKAIPDLALEVQAAHGAGALSIPGPSVEVVGTLDPDGGGEALRDIAPPVDIPVRTYRLLVALAAILGAGALAYAVARQLKKPKPAIAAPALPPEPAHVRARKALEALLAEDLANQGRQRELYFRLSEIVRRYLGEHFGFDAIELTTEELLSALRRRPTPGLDLAAFANQCHQNDLVKFAKLEPDANVCKGSVDAALSLVQATHQASLPMPGGRSA
jgi:hypothetical protein